MARIRSSRSPAKPWRNPLTIGMPPATAASKPRCAPRPRASASSSAPLSAMTCLLAVTTDLPASSARRIHAVAGSSPPITSTTTAASEPSTTSMSSVQTTSGGTQSTRLRSTLRLQICVSRRRRCDPSQRMRATARPTVPKPTSATGSASFAELRDMALRRLLHNKKNATTRPADDGRAGILAACCITRCARPERSRPACGGRSCQQQRRQYAWMASPTRTKRYLYNPARCGVKRNRAEHSGRWPTSRRQTRYSLRACGRAPSLPRRWRPAARMDRAGRRRTDGSPPQPTRRPRPWTPSSTWPR